MSLYDRMILYVPCDFLPVAKVFAECFSYIDSPGGSGLIVRELSVFFKERERCSKRLDECNREAKEISGKRGKKIEADAHACAELIRDIDEALRVLLNEMASNGVYLTGGQLSALTRYYMPADIREKLCDLKINKKATLPEAERLSEQDAAALFTGLRESGFIGGKMSDFMAYFARGQSEEEKYCPSITWKGTLSQLAYLIYRYCGQIKGLGAPINREKAFCRIFGITDKSRASTMRPYLFDFRTGKKKTCRGGKKIDDVFNALPAFSKSTEAR